MSFLIPAVGRQTWVGQLGIQRRPCFKHTVLLVLVDIIILWETLLF